ncbi:MAG: RNA 2',3'-cyclic phosphodiesterase [Terracidiphilus sp.]
MRLFVGIPLSFKVRAELAAVLTAAMSKPDGWRWASAESWHITLQFLGKTPSANFELISARLRAVQSPAVPIQINELDFFERAGIFFAGVSLRPELAALYEKVKEAATQSGFTPDTRAFHPHITLARTKDKIHGRTLRTLRERLPAQPEFSPFLAEEFWLFESFLSPAGARYEIRERFALTPD